MLGIFERPIPCFRFNLSRIPDDQLQRICPLSAVSQQRGGGFEAEATSGRRGEEEERGEVSKMWQQATAFCARPHYQREVTPVRERSAGQSRLPVSLISSPFLGLAAWLSQRQKEVFTFATD